MSFISYLTYCLKNDKLLRWSDKCMPLKIYVAPFRWYKEKGNEYFYYAMIKEAFEIWKQASNGKISFEFVDNLYASQINIEWKRVDRTSLGHCLFNFDPEGRLFSAEIEIGLSDGLIHQQYENKNEVRHTIIHEIGHALGVNHSPYPEDIMYVPHQYGVTSVSKRDMLTLKWLYNFPVGATQKEILAHYDFSSAYTLDHLIYSLENPNQKIEEGISQQKRLKPHQEKVLHYEQDTLADINKYNLSLQNITVSSNMQEYFKKIRIQKNLEGKD
ncbi:MAG: hypothetical protein A2039_09570 [Candidatus Melainabacteria bacterium GWA2_34_9]|nr:MAG: hypothetical protein A2039_09570 [Candidatus Melainabacteria bacterium GWA2_34_9]